MCRQGKREPQVKRIAQAYGVKNVLSSQEHPAVQFCWKQESEQELGEVVLGPGIDLSGGVCFSAGLCCVCICLHPVGQEVI